MKRNNLIYLLKSFFLISLLTACSCPFLSVQTDYVTNQSLASYYVGSPDPRTNNPPFGQRLIVTWSIPKSYRTEPNMHLDITIQFRNQESIFVAVPINKLKGTYVYALLNDDFIKKQGLLAYKINLVSDNGVIEEWLHQMWTEIIQFPSESNSENHEINKEQVDDKEFEFPD